MALDRNAKYPGRYDAPTPGQPQGAFKNRTSPTSQDGSYLEKDWLNDWSGFFSSLLDKAGITPDGNVDEVGASQYMSAFEQLAADGEVDPINNDWNGYFDPEHQEQLPSPAGYPVDSGSGGTVYGAGDEWSLGCFSTTAANTISSDADGVIFSGSIEKRYTFTTEQIALIDVNKVPVYIKDQDGKEYFFKNGDTGVTVSKLGTTLTVTLSNAIFTVPGITKVWRFFVTESVGRVVELGENDLFEIYKSKFSLSTINLYHIQDQKPSSTSGGNSVIGINKRDLNTEITANIAGASLSSNVITLPAGEYYCEAQSVYVAGYRIQTYIYNETTSSKILTSSNCYSSSADVAQEDSFVSGRFILNSESEISLSYNLVNPTVNGLGFPVGGFITVDYEVYSDIKIWKVS